MLVSDTTNRSFSIALLCSSRNWLSFGKAGSEADFWNLANTLSKERSFSNSENDNPKWNWKCSCSVLESLGHTSSHSSTLSRCNGELFAKPMLLLLIFPYICCKLLSWVQLCGDVCYTQPLWCYVKESYRSSLPVDVMEIDHKYDVAFMSTGSKLHCRILFFWYSFVSHAVIKERSPPSFPYNHLPWLSSCPTSIIALCLLFHPFIYPLWLTCHSSSLACSRCQPDGGLTSVLHSRFVCGRSTYRNRDSKTARAKLH